MKNYTTVIVPIVNADTVKTVDFPNIEGYILGFATTVIGTRASTSAQVVIKEGASDLHRPIDLNFTETVGRCNFEAGLLPLHIENPGALSAQILVPAGSDTDFSVEVLIVSEKRYC